MLKGNEGEDTHGQQAASDQRLTPIGFYSVTQLGVLSLHFGWDAGPLQSVISNTHLYAWVDIEHVE